MDTHKTLQELPKLDNLEFTGKVVLLRVDFNVPVQGGEVGDTARILAAGETLRTLRERGAAKIVLLSHLGRPKGTPHQAYSLRPLVPYIQRLLHLDHVTFAQDCIGGDARQAVADLPEGGVILMENLRFHAGEEGNDSDFAEKLAQLGDAYVNDAFSASHRAHASVEALPKLLPSAAGRHFVREVEALAHILENPKRPMAAIVGGAKVSTKLELLSNLVKKVDILIIGGGMANTFLFAAGAEVGISLCEKDMADTARHILDEGARSRCEIILPRDVVVAPELVPNPPYQPVEWNDVPVDQMILDVGPASVQHCITRLESCHTLLWNGPLGAFEVPPFDAATNEIANAVGAMTRNGKLVSVAGGGDTAAALTHAGVADEISCISLAGGAFLEWLEGKTLPGIAALTSKKP